MTSLGHDGLNKMLAGYEDKSAKAVCTFAYCKGPGEEPILFQGITEGKIVPARGPPNFGTFSLSSPSLFDAFQDDQNTNSPGWDPIFEYEGETYAEMDKAKKNTISHRYKALQKLRDYFAKEASA